MKNRSLVTMLAIVALVGLFCCAAEAGTSTSKAFRFSVVMPVTLENSARQESLSEARKNNEQVTVQKTIRDKKMIALKTIVTK